MRVGLACQQLSGSFSLWLRAMAPLQRPVIEAELQSAQIRSAPLVAEEKVAPEPTVEILYQGTGWDRLFSQFGDGFTDIAEPTTQLWAQDSFLLPAQAIAVVAESICGTPRNNSAGHWSSAPSQLRFSSSCCAKARNSHCPGQEFVAETWRDNVVNYVCRDRAKSLAIRL